MSYCTSLVLLCYAKDAINLWDTSQGIGRYHVYTVEQDRKLQSEVKEQVKS